MAARLVSHLRGPARRIGLTLTDEEFTPTKAVQADPANEVAAVPAYTQRQAVDKLLNKLQHALLPPAIQREPPWTSKLQYKTRSKTLLNFATI